MPLETIERTIDGTAYRIGQLPWLEGVPVYRVIVDAAGDAMIATLLAMTPEQRAALIAGQRSATLPLAMKILGALSEADVDLIVRKLGSVIEVQAGEVEGAYVPVLGLKSHFTGRYVHLLAVMWEAAAHNFGNPT